MDHYLQVGLLTFSFEFSRITLPLVSKFSQAMLKIQLSYLRLFIIVFLILLERSCPVTSGSPLVEKMRYRNIIIIIIIIFELELGMTSVRGGGGRKQRYQLSAIFLISRKGST